MGGKRDATALALKNTTREPRAAILKKLLRGALQSSHITVDNSLSYCYFN